MSNKYSTKSSQTNWERLHNVTDDQIDFSDIPEVTKEQLSRAVMRINGKVVERRKREKVRVNMYLDEDIVAFFKAKANGRGYQTLINDTLRQTIAQDDLETLLRRIIREELQPA